MTVMQYFVLGMILLLMQLLPAFVIVSVNLFFSSYNCRCCEYALLVLEYWADAPEIQRAADLYEDLIRCCVADAMSEVFDVRDSSLFPHDV